jgi:CRP/FNR family transcriptional regulator
VFSEAPAVNVNEAATVDWARLAEHPALEPQRHTVQPETVLYAPNTPAESLYVIQRGQVRLYQPGPNNTTRLVEILGTGEWFGVESLARVPQYQTAAVAVVPTVVAEIKADRVLAHFAHQPNLLADLNRQLAEKVLAARHEAATFVFEDCNSRLINALLRFSGTAASTRRDDGVVLRITHQQLAQAIGVARETVSLALTQLRQRNLLRTGRNQLFFDPEVLRQFRLQVSSTPAEPANAAANGEGVAKANECLI